MRRIWQALMIWIARRNGLTRIIQSWRATSNLSRRYVAGESPAEAVVRAVVMMERSGLRASLFFLGKYVTDPDIIAQTVVRKIEIGEALAKAGLDVHVSLDSTQIGQIIDAKTAQKNAALIAAGLKRALQDQTVEGHVSVLMFDMEDDSVIDDTIALHDGLADQGLPVALTLQAYLKRTEADLKRQIERGGKVRLVKGAFVAKDDVAFTSNAAIKANSRRLIDLMLSEETRKIGFYPIIATHDDKLQAYAIEKAQQNGWAKGDFEFEMLLGVRTDVAERLAAEGHRVRLYTPFGVDWWPYAIRRIGENPANAALLARSLVS